MAKTYNIGNILNPVGYNSANGGNAGLIPAANVIVKVDSWADELEPRRTPILSRVKKGKSVDLIKLEWGQSYHTPVSGTIAEDLDNAETDITLATGNGKWLQKFMVLEIINYFPGTTRLDYSTREQVLITSEPNGSDTIGTVQRGFGTAIPNIDNAGLSHPTGAYWSVVGVAMPYNENFTLSPFTRGDRIHNFPQRFYGMVGADQAARNTPSWEESGDQMLRDFKTETLRQKFFLERAIVSGQRHESAHATTDPYAMGGIDYFITNHSGRVNNLGGKTLSAYDLEDVLREMFKEVDDGGAKTLVMGVDTAAIFDTLLNPLRQASMTDSKINLVVDSLKFRWGTLEIMPTQHMPEGMILFTDFSDISLHPYKGCDWQTKSLATDGPYDKMAIWGDFTLKVDKVERMGKIHNFNMDLNAYPRKEFF